MTNTTEQLTAQVEGKLETLRLLLDAVDRGGWHDEDTHPDVDDPDDCPVCPLLVDEYGDDPHEALHALPLEVVAKVGRPLTVLLTYGGPNIYLEHDLGERSPHVDGYWGSYKVVRYDDELLGRAIDFYFPDLDD